jgi:23S rRNA pseudouridine1911/1915/1917 synthase
MLSQQIFQMSQSNTKNLRVIFEDNHLIAVNKFSGDLVQGDATGDKPLSEVVQDYLKEKYNKPGNVFTGVIHRLDRPVSGLVIFAKTSKALTRMNQMFKDKTIQKTYWAIVEEAPIENTGTLVGNLKRNPKNNKSFVTRTKDKEAKRAELSYALKGKGDRYFYLEVSPKTGRHHQIRVQLSHNKTIIKGDLKYGAKRSNKDGSISLHARKLNFIHPISKEPIEILASVPQDPIWLDFEKKA